MANQNAAKKQATADKESPIPPEKKETPVTNKVVEELEQKLAAAQDQIAALTEQLIKQSVPDSVKALEAESPQDRAKRKREAANKHYLEKYPEKRVVVTIRTGYFNNKIRHVGVKFQVPAGFPDSKWFVNNEDITKEEIAQLVAEAAEDEE